MKRFVLQDHFIDGALMIENKDGHWVQHQEVIQIVKKIKQFRTDYDKIHKLEYLPWATLDALVKQLEK